MCMRKTRGRGLTDFPVSPSSFTQMDALQGDHCIVMLRQETIKCKLCLLSLSKFDVLELYRACVEYVILHSWQFSCPTCGIARGDWVRSGTYERWAVTYDYANGPVVTRMKIQRLLCRHCRGAGQLHTHAVLPDFIIPYRQYSIQFILHFLMLYYTGSCSVEDICMKAGIEQALLYEWDRIITKNREIWSGLLTYREQNGRKRLMADFVRGLLEEVLYPEFAALYCLKSPKSFLQAHKNPAHTIRLRL